MSHKIYHGLDLETAKKVSEKAIETYTKKYTEYNPQFRWVSDTGGEISFRYSGIDLKGTVEIVGPVLVVKMKVPFLLKPFMGAATRAIESEVNKWVKAVKEGRIEL